MKIITILAFIFILSAKVFGCGATISPSQTLCYEQGNTYTVTFTGTGGVAPYTFTYHVNSGGDQTIVSDSSGVATLTVTMTAQGNYNYTVTNVTDNASCSQNLNTSSHVFLQGNMNAFISGTTTVLQNSTPGPVVTFNCSGGVPFITFYYTINGGDTLSIVSNNQGMAFLTAPTDVVGTFVYVLVGYQSSLYCPSSGISNISTNSVTITVNPAPPAPSGSFSCTTPCDHYVLNFHGSGGLTSTYTYTYTVNGVTNTATGGANLTINGPSVSMITNYTFSGVSVTNNGSTGTLTGGGSLSVGPYIYNTISCNNTSVCLNGTNPIVHFSQMFGNSSSVTFQYSINNGPTQTVNQFATTANISVPTNVAGTFTYVVYPTNSMCDRTQYIPVTITVKPLPTATISGTTAVCNGSTSPLITFTGTSGTGPYTFTYKINGGVNQTISTSGSSSTVTLPVSTSSVGTFVYSLVSVSSVAGCSQNQSGSATVTVNAKPTASIAGNTSVCQNANSSPITLTGAGGTLPYTFVYSLNGGANQSVSSGGTSSATVNQSNSNAGTYSYQLVSVSAANGCSQTYSNNAVVLVKEAPQAAISGSSVVCQNTGNQQVLFTSPGIDFPYTYSYKLNGGTVQTITSNSSAGAPINVSSSTVGTFTYDLLNVTGANGCSQAQSGSAIVVVNSLPTASISGNATVCLNASQPTLVITPSSGSGSYDIIYNVNGGSNQTLTSVNAPSVSLNVSTSNTGSFLYNLVSIADSHGCSTNLSNSASVVVNGLPSATISGSSVVCMNDASPTVNFNGSGGNGSYNFVYTVNNGNNQTIISNGNASVGISVPSNNAATFEYNLISVTDANGCSQSQNGSAIVVVNSLPTASISGNATVCLNASQPTLVITPSSGSGSYDIIYNVNGGSNQTLTSVNGPSVSLNVPTSNAGNFLYNLVSIADSHGCSTNLSNSASVVVNGLPSATISGSSVVCMNDASPTVNFNGSGGNGSYNFVYTVNNGNNQTIISNGNASVGISVPSNNVATFEYNLISVTDANGCSQSQNGSAIVVVNSLPTASISGNATACLNDSEPTLVITPSSGSGSYDITYNVNGGSNQTLTSVNGPSVSLNVPTSNAGNFLYNLVSIADSHGCSTNLSNEVTVVVHSLPVATISGGANVCQDDSNIELTIEASGDNGPFEIQYNVNGINNETLSTNGTVNIEAPLNSPGTLEYNLLSVTDLNGCTSNLSETETIVINAIPASPTITASGSNSICEGESITLTSSATDNLWSTGETSQSITVAVSGEYFVEQILLGCSSPSSLTFTLEVNELVNPQFQLTSSYCKNDLIENLPSTSLNGIEGTWSPAINNTQTTTYTFTPISGACASVFDQQIVINALPDVSINSIADQCVYSNAFELNQGIPAGGSYTVDGTSATNFDPSLYNSGTYLVMYSFTNNNGCVGTAGTTVMVDECLAVDESSFYDIEIYPNPSNGFFNFILPNNQVYLMEVFDQFGKKVLSSELNTDNSRIDLTEFENGVYTIRVISETQIWNKSVIKH